MLHSLIANILARESLTVQLGSFPTASFDVEKRVLKLPTWSTASKEVSDLLISHEVGHALFTPVEFMAEYNSKYQNIPFHIFNIVEDIRIEKLIQSQYLGLRRIYLEGYTAMLKDNFFGKRDFSKESFLNRLNVQSKCRFLSLPFSPEEKKLFDLADSCVTWQEVVAAVIAIHKFLNQSAKQNAKTQRPRPAIQPPPSPPPPPLPPPESEDSLSSSDSEDTEDTEEDADAEAESTQQADDESEDDTDIEPADYNSDCSSMDSLSDTVAKHASTDKCTHYSVPNSHKLRAVIHDFKKVLPAKRFLIDRQSEYPAFLKRVKESVDIIYKRFYLKRSAARMSRTQESVSGSIDCSKLWRYRTDDEIFSTIQTISDDVNHGLVLMIDYSGSMHKTLASVLEHALELALFCKKASIPFEVYGFNSNYDVENLVDARFGIMPRAGALFSILSSRMSRVEFDVSCRYIHDFILSREDPNCQSCQSCYEHLAGTPLVTSLFLLSEVIGDIKKRSPDMKLNVFVLTDGKTGDIIGTAQFHCGADSTVRANGHRLVSTVIHYLRNKHSCKFTNLHIIADSVKSTLTDLIVDSNIHEKTLGNIRVKADESLKILKKDGFIHFQRFGGYDDAVIVASPEELEIDDDEFVVAEDDSLNQMKNKYVKYAVESKAKHSILNIFADAIS